MPTFSPRITALVAGLGLLAAGCSSGGTDAPPAPEWQYTTETEGNITTVITTAGSRWGAMATLQEQLSIGIEEGDEEYMFAFITGIWPTDDKVLIADRGLPAVRAYDLHGNYLFDVGRPGQGPGEYERPSSVAVLPDGRILVTESSRVQVYEPDGTFIEQWTAAQGGMQFFGPGMTTITTDGTLYRRVPIMPEGPRGRGFDFANLEWGMRALDSDGEADETIDAPSFDYEPPVLSVTMGDSRAITPVPFAPQPRWRMLADGGFLAGLPSEYRFEIRRPDGHTVVVLKYHEPVPVADGEIEIRLKSTQIVINGRTPKLEWGEIDKPEFKPAYDNLYASRDGRIFVARSGRATVDPECLGPNVDRDTIQQSRCVDGARYVDVFEPDGMFVGSFELPAEVQLYGPNIDGDSFWTGAQDEYGTVTVKQFRIVPPAGGNNS